MDKLLFSGGKYIKLQEETKCGYDYVENLRATVGAWLTSDGRNYDDVQQVLTTADKATISSLIQVFQGA